MKRKYGALGFVAGLYQVLGVLTLVAGAVLFLLALITRLTTNGGFRFNIIEYLTVTSLPTITLIVSGIVLYAFGQLINLLRDVELNTRISAARAAQSARAQRQSAQYLKQTVFVLRQAADRPVQQPVYVTTAPAAPAPPAPPPVIINNPPPASTAATMIAPRPLPPGEDDFTF